MTFRKKAISIIQNTFSGNPAVDFTIGTKGLFQFRKKRLASFMFDFCNRRNGVFLSTNEKGVICFYQHHTKVLPLITLWDELCVGFFAIGPFRLWRVLQRSKEVKKRHQKFSDFIHCWYLGVETPHRDMMTALELKNLLFEASEKSQLPILAETTILKNKRVYERIGFKTYDTIDLNGVRTYCMSFSL